MNNVANTLRRLAYCMSPRQCVHRPHNCSITTLNRILESLHRRSHCRLITVVQLQRRITDPQNHSPEVQMLFNIHNPSQDHRDRGACGFLLTS